MTQYVYIIGASAVKIGTTGDLPARLTSLQAGSPVRLTVLWATEVPEGGDTEMYLHRKFADSRLHGEWFDLDGDAIEKVGSALAERIGLELPPRPKRPDVGPQPWYSQEAISTAREDVAMLFGLKDQDRMSVAEIKAALVTMAGVYNSMTDRQLSRLLGRAFGETLSMTISGKRVRGYTREMVNRRPR